MKSSELREQFLSWFEKRSHTRVRSSSLIPLGDPTLFFTNAGMVQFKDVFLGLAKKDYKRAASSQKCMRVSGKHNDLENVGHTPRHHTFFEMLGNFSFGDYFKEEAIAFAWEFLTSSIGLPKERLLVTVFRQDDEAEKLWRKHISKDRIYRLGEEDNFWAMGETGPCGPCSEILWDFGGGSFVAKDFASDRFMEIWNLVFMQFNRMENGTTEPLAKPSIDTGMGLERLAAIVQGKKSNWETDLFVPIISKIEKITGRKAHVSEEDDTALRVIADHIRGITFLIADGVTPSNDGRGYVLRRIMRRAIRYGKKLGQDGPFMAGLAGVVVDEMGDFYPELAEHKHLIDKVITAEEERFMVTLDRGLEILQASFKNIKQTKKIVSGDVVFKLYDTYGFPKDLTEIISAEHGFKIDANGFDKLMEEQRKRARSSWKGTGEEAVASVYKEIAGGGIKTKFVGYTKNNCETEIIVVLKDGGIVKEAHKGDEIQFITNETPFYGESGGQIGDTGLAVGRDLEIEIVNTKKPVSELIVHYGVVKKGALRTGDQITLAIDADRRQDIRRNHTATHILHKALREVLGEHAKQAGSLVEPARLRFDFSHFQAVSDDELSEIERRANEAVLKNLEVETKELKYDEAVSCGALAFFGEKYGERVRMVDVAGFSRELCGGTHVKATGEIGLIKIVSESSVAAGTRRIEAITGRESAKYVIGLESDRKKIAGLLKSSPSELLVRIQKLVDETSRLGKDLQQARIKKLGDEGKGWQDKLTTINGVAVHIDRVNASDIKELDAVAEERRNKIGSGVVVCAANINDKIAVTCAVSQDLVERKKADAGNMVKAVSAVFGGKGGGRADFAHGGGADIKKFEKFEIIALKMIKEILEK